MHHIITNQHQIWEEEKESSGVNGNSHPQLGQDQQPSGTLPSGSIKEKTEDDYNEGEENETPSDHKWKRQ